MAVAHCSHYWPPHDPSMSTVYSSRGVQGNGVCVEKRLVLVLMVLSLPVGEACRSKLLSLEQPCWRGSSSPRLGMVGVRDGEDGGTDGDVTWDWVSLMDLKAYCPWCACGSSGMVVVVRSSSDSDI